MYCTQEFLRSEIEVLKEIVDDIGTIASNIKAGANASNMTFLEKRGVQSLIEEIYERLQKYENRHNDVVNFQLKEE